MWGWEHPWKIQSVTKVNLQKLTSRKYTRINKHQMPSNEDVQDLYTENNKILLTEIQEVLNK